MCIRCPNAEELKASQGQGLVAAMAEVPAPFFQEGFDIDQAALWEEVVQVGWGCSGLRGARSRRSAAAGG